MGKSIHAALGEIVPWSLHSNLIWIVAPKYRLARPEFIFAFEALHSLHLVNPRDVSLPSRDMPARMVTRTGCEIVTNTTSDIDQLVAEAPDLVVVCEPGLMEEEVINAMRIRLTTRRGVMFIAGTLKRANPWVANAYLRWRRWPNAENAYATNVPLWENTYDFPGGRQDPEVLYLERVLPRQRFLEEVVGLPMASEDLVFASTWKPMLRDGTAWHVQPCAWKMYSEPTRPDLEPVYIWVDPGYGPGHVYAVIAAQLHASRYVGGDREVRIFEEFCESGMAQTKVIEEVKRKRWAPNIREIVVDPWAARSHVFGADSPQEVWGRAFPGKRVRCEIRAPVEDGVQAINDYLLGPEGTNPRLFVDDLNCPRTLWEFEHWRRSKTTGKPDILHCDALKAIAAGLLHLNLDTYHGDQTMRTHGFTVPTAGPIPQGLGEARAGVYDSGERRR